MPGKGTLANLYCRNYRQLAIMFGTDLSCSQAMALIAQRSRPGGWERGAGNEVRGVYGIVLEVDSGGKRKARRQPADSRTVLAIFPAAPSDYPAIGKSLKELDSALDGWHLYNPEAELKLMGLPNDQWRISKVTKDKKVGLTPSVCSGLATPSTQPPWIAFPCPTPQKMFSLYPPAVVVPADVEDSALQVVGKFRARGTLPILSYIHPKTKVCLFGDAGVQTKRIDEVHLPDDLLALGCRSRRHC